MRCPVQKIEISNGHTAYHVNDAMCVNNNSAKLTAITRYHLGSCNFRNIDVSKEPVYYGTTYAVQARCRYTLQYMRWML